MHKYKSLDASQLPQEHFDFLAKSDLQEYFDFLKQFYCRNLITVALVTRDKF